MLCGQSLLENGRSDDDDDDDDDEKEDDDDVINDDGDDDNDDDDHDDEDDDDHSADDDLDGNDAVDEGKQPNTEQNARVRKQEHLAESRVLSIAQDRGLSNTPT